MSADWYLIEQPYYTQGDETFEFEFDGQRGFSDFLLDTPVGKNIILCKGKYDGNSFETESTIKGIVKSETPDVHTKGFERQVLVPLNTIDNYKYIKYDGVIWLIMNRPANNGVYEKVVLYQCNYVARWQNENLKIVNKPFVVTNASQYNSGVKDYSKSITLGYNQLLIYTSLDDETLVLKRDKRMFLDHNTANPIVYELTRPDTVSFSYGDNRVMNLLFSESQYNPDTDNIDLMICDYKTKELPTEPIEITYVGEPTIRCGGNAKTFSVDCGKGFTWELVLDDCQIGQVSIEDVGENKCKIKCVNNLNLVGSLFKLKVLDDTETLSELVIKIIGGV